MEQQIAVIDLGSNTWRINIYESVSFYESIRENENKATKKNNFETKKKNLEIVFEAKYKVRLSENMDADKNLIHPDAIQRALEAIVKIKQCLVAFPEALIISVATEAIRRARNGRALIELLEQTAGWPIDVISGKREAFYGFLAVKYSLPMKDAIIIDTGGGSLELSLMQKGNFVEGISLPLGCIILSEEYTDKGDMTAGAIYRLFNRLYGQLESLDWLKSNHRLPVITLGGTHRALGKIWQSLQDKPLPLHGSAMSKENFHSFYGSFLESDSKKRQVLLGKNKDRADIITAGLAPLAQIIRFVSPEEIVFCEKGLRDGIVFANLFQENVPE